MWQVEKILDSKREGGKEFFLVKWLGWKAQYNSWEPEEHLKFIPDMVEEFKRRQKLSTTKKTKGKKSVTFSPEIKRNKEDVEDYQYEYEEDIYQNDENYCPNLCSNSKKIKKTASPVKASQKTILRDKNVEEGIQYVPKKIYGMFQTDIPCEIEEHAMYAVDKLTPGGSVQNKISNLMVKVKWLRRCDGTEPESTWYLSAEVKAKCPQILLNYYEKYIKFTSS